MAIQIPTLETKRLILRPYRPADQAGFVALHMNASVRQFRDAPLSETAAVAQFEKLLATTLDQHEQAWAVMLKSDALYVGHVFLAAKAGGDAPELGIMIDPCYQNRGLATEAVRAMVDYSFAVGTEGRVMATVALANEACQRLLERVGMMRVREDVDEKGRFLVFAKDAADLKDP